MKKAMRRGARSSTTSTRRAQSHVGAIHRHCGVYTADQAARRLLDWVEWTEEEDLRDAVLLEPACGDGALLLPAAERLCKSLIAHGLALSEDRLSPRIRSFELHALEAAKARRGIRKVLVGNGIPTEVAQRIAGCWIRTGDFLLSSDSSAQFTHVVANPPYVRWSSLPAGVRRRYEDALPAEAARGDLCLAFVDQMVARAKGDAAIGLLISDRWLYSAYADAFWKKRSTEIKVERHEDADPSEVFRRKVLTYPALLLLRRQSHKGHGEGGYVRKSDAAELFTQWAKSFGTLEEAGCDVRVGPALGNDAAFVIDGKATVEQGRLARFLGPHEIGLDDKVRWSGRRVAIVHDADGLVDLAKYPKLANHLRQFREQLEKRSCVSACPDRWYRTIDRITRTTWRQPKLLVPELARAPRIALDTTGVIPSHGIYAIMPGTWPIAVLHAVLSAGVLGATLHATAPKVNSQCLRSYKKFLVRIPLPKWEALPKDMRTALEEAVERGAWLAANETIAELYGVRPSELNAYATLGWHGKLEASPSAAPPGPLDASVRSV